MATLMSEREEFTASGSAEASQTQEPGAPGQPQPEEKLSERDKLREQSDVSFHPCSDDWQRQVVKYDKNVDYYSVLGVDEYETRDGVNEAYQRLSAAYVPDNVREIDTATSQMRQQMLAKLREACTILSDNPSRRCYDR